ncbi:MAG: SIR2 family NAD-dependent protein deacylase [Methylococcaceae bacterium]
MFDPDLLNALRKARHIAVFTGAGVSAESGIPTFRDAQTGLWKQFDATRLASPQAYLTDKALVWGWYEWRRMKALKAAPNPAHLAIVALAEQAEKLTVITQNVDDLHERAGSAGVIHLHGSLHKPRCFACARPYEFSSDIPEEPENGRRLEPPRCEHCGGSIRPGVVWFGEVLPKADWQRAEIAVNNCDVLISIGTSSLVWPAAQIPKDAIEHGATVIQINPDETALDKIARYNLRGKAGDILPRLVEAIRTAG